MTARWMRARRVAWAATAILLGAAASSAQYVPLRFGHFGADDGLSNQIATCVLRDRSGYLWVGTENGLNRYDGYAFEHFLPDPAVPDSIRDGAITALLEDRAGRLWVGTRTAGLQLFDRRRQTFRTVLPDSANPKATGDLRIYRLFEDDAGRLWVGTAAGLHRLSGDDAGPESIRIASFRHDPRNADSLSHDRVTALAQDASGALWVGTRAGLNRLVSESPPRFVRFRHDPLRPEGLADDEVYSLLRDSKGDLWVGTWGGGGLSRVSAAEQGREQPRFVRYPHDPKDGTGFHSGIVLDAIEGKSGDLWFAGGDSGQLVMLPRDQRDSSRPHFVALGPDPGNPYALAAGSINRLHEDSQGLLWVAAMDGGLNRLDPATAVFRLYRHHAGSAASLPDSTANAVVEGREGTLWVGTADGLAHISPPPAPGQQPVFTIHAASDEPGRLRSPGVGALLFDSRLRLWVGTLFGGLHLLQQDGRGFANYRKDVNDPQALGSDTILSLLEDAQGTIWVGTYGGLYRMQMLPSEPRPRFAAFRHRSDDAQSLSNDIVEALADGGDGTIWAGTQSGLNHVDPQSGRVTRYLPQAGSNGGLSDRFVVALLRSSSGVLWIGTRAGLCRREAGTRLITPVALSTGLSRIRIQSLAEDAAGRLWVGTIGGLFRLDPVTGETLRLGKLDGLPSETFTRGASHRGATGTVYLGTTAGLVAFDPADVVADTQAPPVVLTSILLANRAQAIGVPGGLLPAHPSTLEEIDLRHTENIVGLEFAALGLRQPSRNRYSYRLEGLYDEWIETDADHRRATFTNLPPGRYVFRVRAANHHGAWNNQGVALALNVRPPPWKTWWAYSLYVITLGATAYAVVRHRLATFRRRREELERLVAERTAELAEANAAKSVFLANMSHELRTPLNAVLGFAHLLGRRAGIDSEDRESLAIIRRSGEHLLGLINDILSIARIEAGKLTLAEQPMDLPGLLLTVKEIVGVRAEAKGLELVLEQDGPLPPVVRGDEGKLRQVLINLAGNAVKFTSQGRVVIRARWVDGRGAFEIEDSGPGIAPEELGRLFQAFSQTESGRAAREGTGLGLVISQQIVHLMGGEIRVSSTVGQGTTFRFDARLPVSGEAPAAAARSVVGLLQDGTAAPRILVVDDTDDSRHVSARLLSAVGFDVREAANGREALAVWRAWRPALIFMDIRMPVMDGRAAMRAIRAEPGGAAVRIVALTASAFEHERAEILACGADAFVAKPCRVETLYESIASLIGVRYVYDQAPLGSAAPPRLDERLATLDPDRAAELYLALAQGDVAAAAQVAERIAVDDAATGAALLTEIRAFRFDEMLSALEALEAQRKA